MKTAMKLKTITLAVAIMTGGAWAQSTDAIDQARSVAQSLQQKQAIDSNAALNSAGAASGKPAPGAPQPAVKPAVIPGSKPVAAAQPAPAAKETSADHNRLERVNVIPGGDTVQVEITSSRAVTPRVSKMSSPARVLVELPGTVIASSQSKISVGSAGVKGVRIGMDGKTPPTTSVVVDLDKALAYDITPGTSGKLVLTLHAQGVAPSVAKATPLPAPSASKPATQPRAEAKTIPVTKPAVVPAIAPKVAVAKVEIPKPATSKPQPAKPAVVKAEAPKPVAPAAKPAAQPAKTVVAAKSAPAPAVAAPAKPAPAPKPEEKHWAMDGKRDPFFSPVVQQTGSGCATGKKCLEIGAINLRGVIKSDTGFIAVVTNNLNKAYFLRENDPVFNGYVVKITGDSVTFQETVQDKLGKPFTREIVKRIFTPAV